MSEALKKWQALTEAEKKEIFKNGCKGPDIGRQITGGLIDPQRESEMRNEATRKQVADIINRLEALEIQIFGEVQ